MRSKSAHTASAALYAYAFKMENLYAFKIKDLVYYAQQKGTYKAAPFGPCMCLFAAHRPTGAFLRRPCKYYGLLKPKVLKA